MGKRLGERLVEAGLATTSAVDQALQQQRITGRRLGDCLVELGLVPETALLRFLAAELNTRFVSTDKLQKVKIPPNVLERVPVRMAESQALLPLSYDEELRTLVLVMAEPQNSDLIKEIGLVAEVDDVQAFVGLRSGILAAIRKYYYGDPTAFEALATAGPGRGDVAALSGALESSSSRATEDRRPGRGTTGGTELRDLLAGRGHFASADLLEAVHLYTILLDQHREDGFAHGPQLARLGGMIARRLGLTPREVAHVSLAAYLHDLGKPTHLHLSLPVIAAQQEPRAEARRLLKAPSRAVETLRLPAAVHTLLGQLYEAFDGSGLNGARGEEIVLGARVLATVDAYLELTRNARGALGGVIPKRDALQQLESDAGRLYDPSVVLALRQVLGGDLVRQRLSCDGREVLVADPNDAVRQAFADALSAKGLVTSQATRLNAAADALLAGEVDALAIGLGFGATELANIVEVARSRPTSAGIPVVVIGDPSDTEAKDKLLHAGVNAFARAPLVAPDAAETMLELYRDHVEHGAPGHVVRGSFDELPGQEVGRLLGEERKWGRLTISAGGDEASLHVENGRAVHASYGEAEGEDAVAGMLSLQNAEFTFDPEAILLELPRMDVDLTSLVRNLR